MIAFVVEIDDFVAMADLSSFLSLIVSSPLLLVIVVIPAFLAPSLSWMSCSIATVRTGPCVTL